MITEETRKRCEILRDFLYQVPPTTPFDMSSWVGSYDVPWGGNADLSCGTSSCACGIGTTIPEFRAAGLHLEMSEGEPGLGVLVFSKENGQEYYSFSAAQEFFGLEHPRTTYWLFADNKYPLSVSITPAMVADRLSYVLEHGEESLSDRDYVGD
jgi:hypothetical protein